MSADPRTEPPPSMLGGAPAQKRALRSQGKQTMNKLLDASMQVLAARGYHATRVDDIVKMAKTSHGTFYLYFANKEDLLRALIRDVSEQMDALAKALGPVGADREGHLELRTWLEGFSDLYTQYGAVIRAWTEAVDGQDADFARLGRDVMNQFLAVFAEQIRTANPPRTMPPEVAALAMVAMVERFHYLVLARELDIDRSTMLGTLTTMVHVGVFGGHRTAGT
jgi:AcrR family transcriptional regulator